MAAIQKCQACGASIYPEHVDQGRAGRWAGQLLCTVCYAEKRGGDAAGKSPPPAAKAAGSPPAAEPIVAEPVAAETAEAGPAHPGLATPGAAAAQRPAIVEADEPISLVDAEDAGLSASKIQGFSGPKIQQQRKDFKRKLTVTGQGATRVRTFHAKIQAESIEFMDISINAWLDDNPDIEVKFATTAVGTMAGKFPEPNIILSIWY